MILGPVLTCIYCCIYPPSCGSKIQLCSSGCSIFNYKKKKNNINFRQFKLHSIVADLTGKKRKKITVLLDFFPDEVILLIIPIVFQSTSAGSATYFVSSALLHLIYSLVLLISNTVVLTAFCALSRCLQRPWDVTPEGEELLRSRKLHRNLRYNIHFYLKQLSASIS